MTARDLARKGLVFFFPCVVSLASGIATAQTFPNRPLRIITAEVGGGADFIARLIAHALSPNLGFQVVVENQGGGSGVIAAQNFLRAPADGHTLLFYSSNIWLLPFLQPNVPFDPLKDFAPVTVTDRAPNVLVVNPALPVRSVRQLIALAKARPGELNYASGSTGAPPHLAAELFKSMAGVSITRVNYKGTGPAVTDLIAGNVQLMFSSISPATPHIKAGKLRALAVTSAHASPLAPGLPTIASAALPGYEAESCHGVLVRTDTPPVLIARLNQEIVRVLGTEDVRAKLLAVGVETAGTTPEEFTKQMRDDIRKWGKLIAGGGVRVK